MINKLSQWAVVDGKIYAFFARLLRKIKGEAFASPFAML